jgi:hypothetical protein
MDDAGAGWLAGTVFEDGDKDLDCDFVSCIRVSRLGASSSLPPSAFSR